MNTEKTIPTNKPITNADLRKMTLAELKDLLPHVRGELYKAAMKHYRQRKEERTSEEITVDVSSFLAALRTVPHVLRNAKDGTLARSTLHKKLASVHVSSHNTDAAIASLAGRGEVSVDDKDRVTVKES